jgi:Fe-S cluster assembly ATP-binding protein
MSLIVQKLNVLLDGKTLISNLDMTVSKGNVNFLLGRNGAGKSTFAQAILGDTRYSINAEAITLDDVDISKLPLDERSRLGIFVSFQNPPEIEGISLSSFLHTIFVERFGNENELSRSTFKFKKHILALAKQVGLKPEMLDRSLNVGFSGGEKKRSEMLQMLLLKPRYLILDEIDSGLDVHALETLRNFVDELISQSATVLFITHNVDFVRSYPESHIFLMDAGTITGAGGVEVLEKFVNK